MFAKSTSIYLSHLSTLTHRLFSNDGVTFSETARFCKPSCDLLLDLAKVKINFYRQDSENGISEFVHPGGCSVFRYPHVFIPHRGVWKWVFWFCMPPLLWVINFVIWYCISQWWKMIFYSQDMKAFYRGLQSERVQGWKATRVGC